MEQFIPCPTNDEVKTDCPEYPNCHLSRHHKAKQELLRMALRDVRAGIITEEEFNSAKQYVRHPMNIIIACRWIHTRDLDPVAQTELPTHEDRLAWLEKQNG